MPTGQIGLYLNQCTVLEREGVKMAGTLEGKVALVTGASAGIGRASAIAFAREGAKVVVSDVNVEGGEETVHIIQDTGGEAIFTKADVSNSTEVEALIAKVVETYGRLDCAHNNAGIMESQGVPIHEHPEETWNRTMEINLRGVWLCMKYEIPQMRNQGGGAIVNTSSVWGLAGAAGFSAYVASKHGVAGLTKTGALENAQQGIRVNSVNPGAINTSMAQGALRAISGGDPKVEEQIIAQMEPVGRMGTPEEVAEAVVWLCSDAASFVTGHTMSVDGGYIAQ